MNGASDFCSLNIAEYSHRSESAFASIVTAHSYTTWTCTLYTRPHMAVGSIRFYVRFEAFGAATCIIIIFRIHFHTIEIEFASRCNLSWSLARPRAQSDLFSLCVFRWKQPIRIAACARSKLYDCYDRLRSTHNAERCRVSLSLKHRRLTISCMCVHRIRYYKLYATEWKAKLIRVNRKRDRRSVERMHGKTVDSECSPRRRAIRHIDC